MRFVLLFVCFFPLILLADGCEEECQSQFLLPNRIALGPEFYHVKRIREGGTKQSGLLLGIRGNYDYIKRYHFYFGIEGLYSKGKLKGFTANDDKIKSKMTDEQIAAKIGYTFQGKCAFQPSLTPFVGYGYFRETNKFIDPSPLTLKFQNSFSGLVFGFLSSVQIFPQWTVGLNLKGISMYHSRCKVSDDPDFDDDIEMIIEDKMGYRIEVPIFYQICEQNSHFEIEAIPFYEYRHYGGRENFPFDFLDTKLKIYGLTIQLGYRF